MLYNLQEERMRGRRDSKTYHRPRRNISLVEQLKECRTTITKDVVKNQCLTRERVGEMTSNNRSNPRVPPEGKQSRMRDTFGIKVERRCNGRGERRETVERGESRKRKPRIEGRVKTKGVPLTENPLCQNDTPFSVDEGKVERKDVQWIPHRPSSRKASLG